MTICVHPLLRKLAGHLQPLRLQGKRFLRQSQLRTRHGLVAADCLLGGAVLWGAAAEVEQVARQPPAGAAAKGAQGPGAKACANRTAHGTTSQRPDGAKADGASGSANIAGKVSLGITGIVLSADLPKGLHHDRCADRRRAQGAGC
jgi:hypothetical protein